MRADHANHVTQIAHRLAPEFNGKENDMTGRLEGKVALVTGAARGIGEAIARAFAQAGAIVYVSDVDADSGRQVARSLGNAGHFRYLDVCQEEQWRSRTQEIVDEHGRLDVLVNNAGITGFEDGPIAHDPEHATLRDWHAVHRTNLDGVFLGCKYAIVVMRATGSGSIINISSRSGMVGIPGAAAYASSKAAIRNHTRTVALYCAEQGLNIRCNAIVPAAILTPLWEPLLGTGPDREVRMREFAADCPMRRFGMPDEVAGPALMLASDESAYMTGTEIIIDGGTLAGTAAPPRHAQDRGTAGGR
jgi:NAD(P)-dependent dehydrogenase (short-subunit alcohol dehydrogenase family)